MKKYLIIDQDEHRVDYVIEQDDDNLTLKRSGGEHWNDPHEELLTLEDTGNGLKLSNGLELDYLQYEELMVLLCQHKVNQRMPTNYTSIEL